MLGYTLSGTGMMLLGLSWVGSGIYIFRGGDMNSTPVPQNQRINQRILGAAIVCFGLAMIYMGGSLANIGIRSDIKQIRYYSGPINCSDITIYTLRGCGWCTKAKAEMDSRGLKYTEIEYFRGMTGEPPKTPNGTTPTAFPTIFIGDHAMGGYSELPNWIDNCQEQKNRL